ncbi:hypothetical protein ACFWM7_12815 [Streptomyces sp. NPDC058375]|uniref:hypothetical protein n=1 Tax=Streptomyces sp. NPDC058375 TaxID=3346467 RepID=UPI003665A68C
MTDRATNSLKAKGRQVFSERAFLSFVDVTDPALLPEYHDWQVYDHIPENRALPGVAWGERWTRIAGAGGLERIADHLAGVDSMTMYWFLPPYEESVAAWRKLGTDSIQWGRGPGIPGVQRPFMGFFTPVKGYAAPHALVSPEVLPYRPNTGVHVTLTRMAEPMGHDAHLSYRREDRVRVPGLLDVPGVAGAWTFSLHEPTRPHWQPEQADALVPHELRARLLYLDQDPLEVAGRLAEHDKGGSVDEENTVFSAPLAACAPFQPCPPAASAGQDG